MPGGCRWVFLISHTNSSAIFVARSRGAGRTAVANILRPSRRRRIQADLCSCAALVDLPQKCRARRVARRISSARISANAPTCSDRSVTGARASGCAQSPGAETSPPEPRAPSEPAPPLALMPADFAHPPESPRPPPLTGHLLSAARPPMSSLGAPQRRYVANQPCPLDVRERGDRSRSRADKTNGDVAVHADSDHQCRDRLVPRHHARGQPRPRTFRTCVSVAPPPRRRPRSWCHRSRGPEIRARERSSARLHPRPRLHKIRCAP